MKFLLLHPKRFSEALKVIACAAVAFTLALVSPPDIAHADDGYVQVQIYNHPNNSELGDLHIYVASYNNKGIKPPATTPAVHLDPPTNIPLSGTTQLNGKGFYLNGSGVTYLVDDYKNSAQTKSEMPNNGPDDPTTGRPSWRGFRIATPYSTGPEFLIGFGCDSRTTVANNAFDYTHLNDIDSSCISYDAPYDTGASAVVTGPQSPTWKTSYDIAKGFNIRYAAFEAAFWAGGNLGEDKANLTNINYYGFPMSIATANKANESDPWSAPTANKSYKHNDQWIRNALKDALTGGGAAWDYSVEDKFIRAVSPQSFPVIQNDWSPIPPNMRFNTNYIEQLAATYNCAGGNTWTIRGAYSEADDHKFTGDPTIINSYQCKACFTSQGSAPNIKYGLTLKNYTLLTNALAPAHNLPDDDYSVRLKIPIGSSTTGTTWSDLNRFILSGDPGGASATVEYQKSGETTWTPVQIAPPQGGAADWDYYIPSPDHISGTSPTATGACCVTPTDCQVVLKSVCDSKVGFYQGDNTTCDQPSEGGVVCNTGHNYTPAVKASAKQASFPIQFGWLDNAATVKHVTGADGTIYYNHSTAPDAVKIQDLTPGQMQWVIPIYEYMGGSGANEPWYDQYGATLNKAQNLDDMVAYVTGYTDAWKYGKVQVNSHSNTYNQIKLVIPDLTDACASDFDNNGSLSADDMLILLNYWGTIYCDRNMDGTTDITDLLVLLADWGQCTPTET
jgi:hypothetical protein